MVLRAMVSTPKPELDEEEDYENPRSRPWDPLLGQQGNNQASAGSSKIDNWSLRMREKVIVLIFLFQFLDTLQIRIRLCELVVDKNGLFAKLSFGSMV